MDAADFLRAYADEWMQRDENQGYRDLEPYEVRNLIRRLAIRIEATEFYDLSPAL